MEDLTAGGFLGGRGFYGKDGRGGIFSWVFSTDHKRIGLLYLGSVLSLFSLGVTIGFLMRLELITRGPTVMGPQTYNSLFTLHGVVMLFLFLIPAILFIAIFRYGPMFGLQLAFKTYNMKQGIFGSPWIGFDHFQRLFSYYRFGEIFLNTVILAVYKLAAAFPFLQRQNFISRVIGTLYGASP